MKGCRMVWKGSVASSAAQRRVRAGMPPGSIRPACASATKRIAAAMAMSAWLGSAPHRKGGGYPRRRCLQRRDRLAKLPLPPIDEQR